MEVYGWGESTMRGGFSMAMFEYQKVTSIFSRDPKEDRQGAIYRDLTGI